MVILGKCGGNNDLCIISYASEMALEQLKHPLLPRRRNQFSESDQLADQILFLGDPQPQQLRGHDIIQRRFQHGFVNDYIAAESRMETVRPRDGVGEIDGDPALRRTTEFHEQPWGKRLRSPVTQNQAVFLASW